ncbi:MAG: hypothetical protein ABF899_08265 [Oenococcus sp.]|uniref:hypothetical protein n=1 Tax=Oenococcus sp. TaxID=1979414 RepID=UPI0039E8AC68
MKLINTMRLLNKFHHEKNSAFDQSALQVADRKIVSGIELLIEIIKNTIYVIPISIIYSYQPVRVRVRHDNHKQLS